MKAPRIALALLSLAAVGACADSASITGTHAPVPPAFNAGGFGIGGGGVMPMDTTTQAGTTSATTPVSPDTSDRRGGFGMGSGGCARVGLTS